MPTLMEEIKPKLVLLVKNEINYREKLKMFSLEVSNYQDSDAKERNNDFFQSNTRLQVLRFRMKIWWRKSN